MKKTMSLHANDVFADKCDGEEMLNTVSTSVMSKPSLTGIAALCLQE